MYLFICCPVYFITFYHVPMIFIHRAIFGRSPDSGPMFTSFMCWSVFFLFTIFSDYTFSKESQLEKYLLVMCSAVSTARSETSRIKSRVGSSVSGLVSSGFDHVSKVRRCVFRDLFGIRRDVFIKHLSNIVFNNTFYYSDVIK